MASKSPSDAIFRTPNAWQRSSERFCDQAAISIPNALPKTAICAPILPRPTSPSVSPATSRPSPACQPPALSEATSGRSRRLSASIIRTDNSDVVVLRLSVPQTVIPRAVQAATSIAAFFGPLVTMSLRFGSASISAAGIGVRSRMRQITSKGKSRATKAAGSVSVSGKTVISPSPDQSASRRAAPA